MKYIDISWPLSESTTCYKDEPCIAIQSSKTFEHDGVRKSLITLSSHTGTHIDAPAHFMANGMTIDQFDPLACCGPAQVIDMTHVEHCITAAHLQPIDIKKDHIILFKTKNSALSETARFDYQFVYIDASAAAYLATCNIRAVGIDYLGIERNQPNHETHTIFMHKKIPIIEGLRLQHVGAKEYYLYCLPLLMIGLDGAPARAVLIDIS